MAWRSPSVNKTVVPATAARLLVFSTEKLNAFFPGKKGIENDEAIDWFGEDIPRRGLCSFYTKAVFHICMKGKVITNIQWL